MKLSTIFLVSGMNVLSSSPPKQTDNNVPMPIGPLNSTANAKNTTYMSVLEKNSVFLVNFWMINVNRSIGMGAKFVCK